MEEVWGETPQEALLDHIYESIKDSNYLPDLYGVTHERPLAKMWIEDPDGNCWEIVAIPHKHHGHLDG